MMATLMLGLVLSVSLAAAQSPREGAGGARGSEQQIPAPRGPGNNLAPPIQDAAPAISRQQALNRVRDSFQGRVLSVRSDGSNWRVRVDQNGTVFNVSVDGRTGEVNRSPE